MTTRELIEKVMDKSAWHLALAMYWRIALPYILIVLLLGMFF